MDYVRGTEVDNNVIEAYRFVIKKLGSHTFHVDALLKVAQYDIHQEDALGNAETYQKIYSYTLTTDSSGRILKGDWDEASDNPDFLWVALAPQENCSSRNPNVQPSQVSLLLSSLLPMKSQKSLLNWEIDTMVIPQGQVPLPIQIGASDHLSLQLQISTRVPPELLLIASGDARYPVTGGVKESMFIPLSLGTSEILLDRLLSVDSIAVVNQSLSTSIPFKARFLSTNGDVPRTH